MLECASLSVGVGFLITGIALVLALLMLWAVFAAPLGKRTITRSISIDAPVDTVWNAVYPFGEFITWNRVVTQVEKTGDQQGRYITAQESRDGTPIIRAFALTEVSPQQRFHLNYTDDSALDQGFWRNYAMQVHLDGNEQGATLTLKETDAYKGIAFAAFRYFAQRRFALKLKRWAETGQYKPGGIFEKPITQFAMATLSAFLLWPVFGLTQQGFALAAIITLVVGLHELGHMAAFRLSGHKSARMIFIPLLGGIALGGRPYNRHFEVAFCALMGAGMSALLVAALAFGVIAIDMEAGRNITLFVLICALFNLANLLPIWKFDGGQVLRQTFRSQLPLAIMSALVLAWFIGVGALAGLPFNMLLGVAGIILLLSMITTRSGVKPKKPLIAMMPIEKAAIGAAFFAVIGIHSMVFLWAIDGVLV